MCVVIYWNCAAYLHVQFWIELIAEVLGDVSIILLAGFSSKCLLVSSDPHRKGQSDVAAVGDVKPPSGWTQWWWMYHRGFLVVSEPAWLLILGGTDIFDLLPGITLDQRGWIHKGWSQRCKANFLKSVDYSEKRTVQCPDGVFKRNKFD